MFFVDWQKVFECMQHSAELLQQRLPNDALQLIAECLLISPYSEKFLEMKAESLFMVRVPLLDALNLLSSCCRLLVSY